MKGGRNGGLERRLDDTEVVDTVNNLVCNVRLLFCLIYSLGLCCRPGLLRRQ